MQFLVYVHKVRSDVILSIPIAPLVPLVFCIQTDSPHVHPRFSFQSFLQVPSLLSLLYVRWLPHFVGLVLFRAITVTTVKFLGHCPVACMLSISYVTILEPSSPNSLNTSPGASSSTDDYQL